MSHILDFYLKNKGNKNIYELAEKYLVKDLLDNNLIGTNKIFELDGIDIESNISGKIIPSMIYTFIYDYKKDFDGLSFGDNFPLILCIGVVVVNRNGIKNINIKAINLNLMPLEEKIKFIDLLVNLDKDFFESGFLNNEIISNKLFSILNNVNSIKNFSNILGFDISKYIRLYKVHQCKNIRLIEYNLWKYIPFYSHKIDINGLDFKQLIELALKTKNK